jgi:hypothetical protein
MSDDKKEPWLNYLALTTVLLAVSATLSTFKGGSFSTRSVMSQSQASDQWSFYQAKSMKGYLYEIQRDAFDLESRRFDAKTPTAVTESYRKKIEDYQKKIDRYETEKADIQKEARRLETIRDDAQRHSKIFGMAVIFLQIAILLSSIAALLKRKAIWILGLAVGAVGLFYFSNGFLLFMQ